MSQTVVNLERLELESFSHGEKFAIAMGEVSRSLGLEKLGCTLHVVPPGKAAFPFHRHHGCDEMFLILSGNGEYRLGEERIAIRAGDCLGAPAGGVAHQIINTGTEPLRYLGFSNNESFDIVEYPDSGKVGMRAGVKNNDRSTATYLGRGWLKTADYWDGE
jgi:uncharacterized cupin superfamily protein